MDGAYANNARNCAAGRLGSAPPDIQTTARLRAVALPSEQGSRLGKYLGLPDFTMNTIIGSPHFGPVTW